MAACTRDMSSSRKSDSSAIWHKEKYINHYKFRPPEYIYMLATKLETDTVNILLASLVFKFY